jgi:putative ABC transport system ATP-binding protein
VSKLETSLVDFDHVSKIYGDVVALKDLTLHVKENEWVAIMGPSGSGKTTLVNLMGCLDTPTHGTVRIDGVEVESLSSRELARMRREKIGMIFQQFHLVPYLTAVENVMLAQHYHSMADEKEAREALDRVGLSPRADHLPKQLSGGEQQRVCVARALINFPRLILADEPTGNLDQANEEIVLELLANLHREGHAIVMVTHAPHIGDLAQRRVLLDHGKKEAGNGHSTA